jgi:hypothetical protein
MYLPVAEILADLGGCLPRNVGIGGVWGWDRGVRESSPRVRVREIWAAGAFSVY